jgi:nitroreductase
MLKDLVLKNRSYRRFYGDYKIDTQELVDLVELARNTGYAANAQALKFMIVSDDEQNKKVFETLVWAAALKDWNGPVEEERPTGYIIILCDKTIGTNKQTDVGIVAQTMMLGATEKGLGGCMIGNINRPLLYENFGIDKERYSIELCLALGKPKEEVRIVDVNETGSVNYYRDENGVHYVPKRKLEDIIYSL